MDNLYRDVSRLNLISNLSVGQERFSVTSHFKDFSHYYFSRFVVNLRSAFKDFSSSELQDLNRKHSEKLNRLSKYPALYGNKEIVPIPKGMVNSYRTTLDKLLSVSNDIHADTIEHDLHVILEALATSKLASIHIDAFSKQEFETAKAVIAKLFGVTGLSHSTSGHVLSSPLDLEYVNSNLLASTGKYYPIILTLNTLLKKIEVRFEQFKYTEHEKEVLQSILMTMAYRLSIFAVIVDHLQGLEHGFVASVNILLKSHQQ